MQNANKLQWIPSSIKFDEFEWWLYSCFHGVLLEFVLYGIQLGILNAKKCIIWKLKLIYCLMRKHKDWRFFKRCSNMIISYSWVLVDTRGCKINQQRLPNGIRKNVHEEWIEWMARVEHIWTIRPGADWILGWMMSTTHPTPPLPPKCSDKKATDGQIYWNYWKYIHYTT